MSESQYKIKKRKAVKIEELPPSLPLEEAAKEEQYKRKHGGPLGILEPFQYETESYQWSAVKNKKNKPRFCILCRQAASFWANTSLVQFNAHGADFAKLKLSALTR